MKKNVRRTNRSKIVRPKDCYFCVEKKDPSFVETEVLRRFLTERGKIVPRSRSGLCSIHQRKLTLAVKQARHLALLAFVV